ncbi:MAG: energy-coupling factor ABC transporter permease [Anaerolineales bacterium]
MNPLIPLLRPEALHIPDGFLSLAIALLFWAITIILIIIAARKTRGEFGEQQIPLMGLMAAFIFAAQMINFPVAGGTSGHLLGGVLAAVTLGPWGGILVMSSVIAVQGIFFQDGGLLAMGANIFNMGLLTALIGYGLYRGVLNRPRNVRLAVIGAAAWLSTMAAAFVTALQLWLSGTSQLNIVLPAMLGVHALIGIGEALITVGAVAFILNARPDLLETPKESAPKGGRGWIWGGAAAALAVIFLAPLASASPDGLERVAEDLGFLGRGLDAPYQILPDYTLPGLPEGAFSTILAGLLGALLVAAISFGISRLLQSQKS